MGVFVVTLQRDSGERMREGERERERERLRKRNDVQAWLANSPGHHRPRVHYPRAEVGELHRFSVGHRPQASGAGDLLHTVHRASGEEPRNGGTRKRWRGEERRGEERHRCE